MFAHVSASFSTDNILVRIGKLQAAGKQHSKQNVQPDISAGDSSEKCPYSHVTKNSQKSGTEAVVAHVQRMLYSNQPK